MMFRKTQGVSVPSRRPAVAACSSLSAAAPGRRTRRIPHQQRQPGSVEAPATATDSASVIATTAEASTDVEPVTITYLASQNWVLDSERELAVQFEEETVSTSTTRSSLPTSTSACCRRSSKRVARASTSSVVRAGKTDIQLQLGVEENAVPVTDEEWVQRMDPLSTEQISLDGVVYGQTIWDTVGGSWVVVYNKTIFADNGIEVPTTYDEFAAACQTLSSAGDHTDL